MALAEVSPWINPNGRPSNLDATSGSGKPAADPDSRDFRRLAGGDDEKKAP